METTADVIVIGAGIQGASLAFHLAEQNVKVLVLERSFVSAGATGRSNGLVRMYYDLASDARLAWLSFDYFRRWADRVGGDCGFVRSGFLHLAPRDRADQMQANIATQQEMGIPVLLVTADDVQRLAPAFVTDDFEIAAFEPESGYADPPAACKAFMDAARRAGARLVQDCRVTGIRMQGDRVIGVESTCGAFSAPIVVNAAGPWATEIGRMVGLELPIRTMRHDVVILRRPPHLGAGHPTVIDDIHQMHFRPEGRSLTLIGLDDINILDVSPDGSTEHARPGVVEQAVDRICLRVPDMLDGSLQSTYCGYEGITVDSKPILGQAEAVGFYLACGFSGTGFKTAPAIGRCLSQVILNGRSVDADLEPYSWQRFSDGRLHRLLASGQAFQVR